MENVLLIEIRKKRSSGRRFQLGSQSPRTYGSLKKLKTEKIGFRFRKIGKLVSFCQNSSCDDWISSVTLPLARIKYKYSEIDKWPWLEGLQWHGLSSTFCPSKPRWMRLENVRSFLFLQKKKSVCLRQHGRSENILKKCSYKLCPIMN